MKLTKFAFFGFVFLFVIACGGVKNTIKNIDNTEMSPNSKYGYDADYPINIFYRNTANDSLNQERFLNALAGPAGEKLFYKKIESCCPFPTSQSGIGAGLLDIYQVNWVGCKKPLLLYFNIYEKGKLYIPVGLTAKKPE
jgi:hypothetical protein